MYTSLGLGLLALYQGDLRGALPMLERAISICQEANRRFASPWLATTLSAAYTLGGRVVDAVPLLTQATAQATAMEVADFETLCHRCLEEAQMLAGRLEEAHALAERTLALARTYQERGHEAYALRLVGDIAMHRNPPARELAAAHYRQALALAEELGMRPLQAHCHRGFGTLYAKIAQLEQARTELAAIERLACRGPLPLRPRCMNDTAPAPASAWM
jgi:tetratricopeptide (TPR) repeat protein